MTGCSMMGPVRFAMALAWAVCCALAWSGSALANDTELPSGHAFAKDAGSARVGAPTDDAGSAGGSLLADRGESPLRKAASDASNYADVWLRFDADRVGLELSAGATPAFGPLDLAIDLVVSQAYPGAVDPSQSDAFDAALGDDYRAPSVRLELGPAFSWGGLFVLPKLGIGYDFERERVAPLVPQAIIIVQAGPGYFESWLELFLYDLFEDGAQDSFYTRNVLLVALGEPLSLGLELDTTVAVKNASGDALRSLPFGAAGALQIRRELTLGLFLGYETQREARNSRHDVLVGRLTATLLWR